VVSTKLHMSQYPQNSLVIITIYPTGEESSNRYHAILDNAPPNPRTQSTKGRKSPKIPPVNIVHFTSSEVPFPSLQIPYYTSTSKPPNQSTKGRKSPRTETRRYRRYLPNSPFPFLPFRPISRAPLLDLHYRTIII